MTAIDSEKEGLTFYLPQNAKQILAENSKFIQQSSSHKFWMPSLKKYRVWHGTYQGTNYYPTSSYVKKVLTIHDINFMHDEYKSDKKKNKYLHQLQEKINRTDHIVAISNFVLDDVKQYIDLKNIPVSIIYNGCNIPDNIAPPEKPQQAPTDSFLFTIGTITEKKNFHVLPALISNNNKFLVIAGIVQSEGYKQRIIDEAKKWDVADRVIFTDSISDNDKYWYLQNCEAFVFPSLAEGFGLPVIEAMHFGKPVILSDKTCLPEIGGDAAYYFDNFEGVHMREVLQKSLADYNRSSEQAERIKQRSQLYKWSNAAAAYLKIYRSLYS